MIPKRTVNLVFFCFRVCSLLGLGFETSRLVSISNPGMRRTTSRPMPGWTAQIWSPPFASYLFIGARRRNAIAIKFESSIGASDGP